MGHTSAAMRFGYSACGLTLASDIAIGALLGADPAADPDISVKRAHMLPAFSSASKQVSAYSHANATEWRLSIPGIASFFVRNGSEIHYIIEGDEGSLATFLLGCALPIAMIQRGFLVLDGTAIACGGKAQLLLGETATGKSSLAAWMSLQGMPILSDGMCVVDTQGQTYPVSPFLRLWRKAADELGLSTTGLSPTRPGLERYFWEGRRPCSFAPIPVGTVVSLNIASSKTARIEPVHGFPVFGFLRAATHQMPFWNNAGLANEHLKLCSAVAGKAEVVKLFCPPHSMPIRELGEIILDYIERARLP